MSFMTLYPVPFKVESLNGSLATVIQSLESAPVLKSLPSTVLTVQTEVAELGSKLADLETQLAASQKELKTAVASVQAAVGNLTAEKVQQGSLGSFKIS
jgi:hypothetical protein